MSLPTLQKSWQFSVNRTIAKVGTNWTATTADLLFQIKDALTGFGSSPWTVAYSCNGTTAGTAGDGVDRWASNANVVVSAALTTAHSWMVLKQAGVGAGNIQILLNASPVSSGDLSRGLALIAAISWNSGFSGGTTTSRPTASDEVVLVNSGVYSSSLGGTGYGDPRQCFLHVMQSTDGENTRFVVMSESTAIWLLCVETPTPRGLSISNPVVTLHGAVQTSAAWPQAGWTAQSLCTVANATVKMPIAGTKYDMWCTMEGDASGLMHNRANVGANANDLTSEWPMFPIGFACATTGARGIIGSIKDMWFGSSGVPNGDTYDASSRTFAQFGQVIVPWDGTNVPVIA